MKVGAVILAAGVSSRMKEFKPMMSVGKKPMVRKIVDIMKAVKADPIVVVTGYKADTLKRCLENTGVVFVHNRAFAETQMFDSLKIGIEYLKDKCERVIVTPVDVPLVKPETIRQLLDSQAPAVKPEYNGQEGHPLIISKEIFEILQAYDGATGLQSMLREHKIPVDTVSVEDEGVIIDANTYEEYCNLLTHEARLSGKGTLHIEYNLQLAVDNVAMNNEMMQLLEMVEFTGSLQTASECINSSYTKSWRKIKHLEEQLGVAIIRSAAGGPKGGGSQLTEEGKSLLYAYQKMQEEGKKMMDWLFKEYFPDELIQKIQNTK